MKSITLLKVKLFQFVFIIGLIGGIWSCTGNRNTDETTTVSDASKMSDSTTGNGNAMKDNTNSHGENSMMNDSNANNHNVTSTSDHASDASFMVKVAEINMEEIKLRKLAQQKGTMAHIKELGKMMVAEHTSAMKELSALAKSKTTSLPPVETEKIKDDYKNLNTKTGKDFDKAYSEMMVNGHKEAIALFEKTQSDTKDAEVKAMTSAMIPKLKTHLEHAEMCKKECEKM